MNPEQQRIAIAESVGWADIYYNPVHGGWMGTRPKEDRDSYHLPDYLNDLNAMHEAEKVLTSEYRPACGESQISGYLAWLGYCGENDTAEIYWCVSTTATQRAEAFLRTLGLWKESK